MRIGNSSDFHPFVENRKLVLGGVEIPYEYGLKGDSDADCVLHSIAEAILGALALGDLGKYFKPKESMGMDSKIILSRCVKMMKDKGYKIVNTDTMILIEEPRMAPYIDEMREIIASILETDVSNVSVKATTMEHCGIIGKGEGCLANTVLLIEEV